MWEKVKKINFKSVMRAFAIVWMLILIIVMTITNIGINKNFNWMTWLSNSMILFGIAVFGIFIGESTGVDASKNKIVRNNEGEIIGGRFQKSLVDYNKMRKAINDIHIYFPLWYDWYIPQRVEAKKIEFLVIGGMNNIKAKNIVKYCTMDNFADLKSHAITLNEDGKEINIRKLQADEIEPVEFVLKGKLKFKQSGPAYYLQAFAESKQNDEMEQGEEYKEARISNRRSNRAIRLISGLVLSLALGILTVGDFMKGNDAQAWMNLVFRIANLVTALLTGYISGVVDVRIQADAITNKTSVLQMFKSAYEKQLFPIYDENEAAKREAEEYKQKLEEAKNDVIDPMPDFLEIVEK